MKIWENFKTLTEARPTLNKRKCWSSCDDCQTVWSEMEPLTENVHMIIKPVQGESLTRFICDNCLTQHKSTKE